MEIATKSNSQKKTEEVDLSRKRVLIIEDFFAFRLTLKKLLRSFDITDIDDASSGEDALKEMGFRKYDIILCDHNLGEGKNGQQVLEEARHRELIDASTVFIMVTAENTMDIFMGTLEYQADDYLIKPITKEALEKKLRDWVRKKDNLKGVEKAIAKGDYEKAVVLCSDLIAKNPKNVRELLKMKGEILLKMGSYERAIEFYKDVLSKGYLPWAMLGLGKARFHAGNYDEAADIFGEIIIKNDKILPAHDMLAQTLEKQGELKKAQRVLQEAIRVSPKAVLRHKALGKISYKNKDLDIAENSFKEAIKQGKNSVLKSPADYTMLAKVMIDKDAPEESLGILQDAGKEFVNNLEAAVQISVAEGFAFKKMNREAEAKEAVKKAAQLSAKLPKALSSDAELDLAKAMYMTGDEEGGMELVKHLVQNNQGNKDVLGTVQGMYKELNREEEGDGIVNLAINEIVRLNNDGVKLVRSKTYEKAIDFFEAAAEKLPGNKIINGNAAHTVMLYMTQSGVTIALLEKAKAYLAAVRNADPTYNRLGELSTMFEGLNSEIKREEDEEEDNGE